MKLLLIAGHGAGDPGAVGSYQGKTYREADETRNVTKALAAELAKDCAVTVYPTDRNAFEDHRSGTLAAVAKFSQYDYVLEIHFNAVKASAADGKTKGVECYVPTGAKSTAAETAICRRMSALGLTNRGVKTYNWSVIAAAHRAGVPSALLEVCFIDDADDMAVYTKHSGEIARAIADGVREGFSVVSEEEPEVTYEQFKEYLEKYMAEVAAKAPSAWSKEARTWAEENEIIIGNGVTTGNDMEYKSNVTREELVMMLFRAFNMQ